MAGSDPGQVEQLQALGHGLDQLLLPQDQFNFLMQVLRATAGVVRSSGIISVLT